VKAPNCQLLTNVGMGKLLENLAGRYEKKNRLPYPEPDRVYNYVNLKQKLFPP